MAVSTSTIPRFSRKHALLIGNQNYYQTNDRLRHTINNVDDISTVLRTMKFDVTTKHDLNSTAIIWAISEFSGEIMDGNLILFYFSGHGCEMNGRNYLLPIDDDLIKTEEDLEMYAINVRNLLNRFSEHYPSSIVILLLDCCRLPYPYKTRKRTSK